MAWYDIFFSSKDDEKSSTEPINETKNIQQPKSDLLFLDGGGGWYGGSYVPILNQPWNGEKTPGELGAVVRNIPQYKELRLRAYDAYTKTDIIKIIASRFFQHVIGSGLKLQCEPNDVVLEMEGITFDKEKFKDTVEARFNVYANSKYCDYSRTKTLHELALDFFSGSYLGGDTLVICRNSKLTWEDWIELMSE